MGKVRLLFKDGIVHSICFPPGKLEDGGTCEFSTSKCRACCPSNCVVTQPEVMIYKYFLKHSARKVAGQILKELSAEGSLFLQWYTCGDCPAILTNKVARIIVILHDRGVVQYGFTRNKKLWEQIPITPQLHFWLSVEDSEKQSVQIGLCAVPNYKLGQVFLYKNRTLVARCSGVWCYDKDATVAKEAICVSCYLERKGCFA